MSAVAVVFLVLSLVLVWGGLAVSIVLLRRDSRLAGDDGDEAADGDLVDHPA